jgi:aryl-alcohol dehydrogenase-like predicted oxidoreductase
LKTRQFGSTSLQVSEIGFGGSRIGGIFSQGKAGRNETVRVLHEALDSGINFYDTADMYAQGESESLVGLAFKDRRSQVIIAGKAGYILPGQRKLISRIKPLVKPVIKMLGLKRENLPSAVSGSLSQNFSTEYIASAVEASLRRLNTDYLDIFQLHSPPMDVIEKGDFLATLESLKSQGKCRHYGIAVDSVNHALACLKYPGISSLQFPFGLLDQEGLDQLIPAASEKGIALIARGCFGGGLLKPTLTEPQLKEMTSKWKQVLAFREVAKSQKRDLLQAALHFSLHSPQLSLTLLGMRTSGHLTSNLQYYNAPPLSETEFQCYVQARLAAIES